MRLQIAATIEQVLQMWMDRQLYYRSLEISMAFTHLISILGKRRNEHFKIKVPAFSQVLMDPLLEV